MAVAVAELDISIDDPKYLKALAHPSRIRILGMLREGQASPLQLSERLGQSLGSVAYHVRQLHSLELIELVETRPRRGATEHFYRAHRTPRFSDGAWEGLGPIAKQRLLSAMLAQIGEYVNGSAAGGGFDRGDANISRIAVKADEKGWKQLARASSKWLAEIDRIEASIQKRTAKTPEHELLDVGLVILLFEALPMSVRAPTPRKSAKRQRNTKSPAGR